MAGNVIELTNANFEAEVRKSSLPVLVDFWAEWCGPCKMIAPTVAQLAGEYLGRLKFGKLNVDNSREIAAEFGIRSIPTLIVFKDGKVLTSMSGAQPKASLKAFLDKSIEKV